MAPGTDAALLDILDEGDPLEVAAWVRDLGQMEARWCDESIPALGGFTPHQAAADPTRREELKRLLASFDAMRTPPGAFTMRTDRLRALLTLLGAC